MLTTDKFKNFLSTDSKKIDGWFFDRDIISFYLLLNLQKHIGIKGDICEIGVWHGKSLTLLSLMRNEGERLFGYDLFIGDLSEKTRSNVSNFGDFSLTELIEGDSSEYTKEMLDVKHTTPIKFLHIDAGHEYHEVLQQLVQFTPYMHSSGIIAMDDYQDREFPGIEAAVLDFSEFDRPRRFVPFFAGSNKMFLCEKQFVKTYQQLLLNSDILKNSCRVTRVRDFTILVGFSKLPLPYEKCIEAVNLANFPSHPNINSDNLSTLSKKFQQRALY
jgi:hypothetical protein